jgi:hypothetical protein
MMPALSCAVLWAKHSEGFCTMLYACRKESDRRLVHLASTYVGVSAYKYIMRRHVRLFGVAGAYHWLSTLPQKAAAQAGAFLERGTLCAQAVRTTYK